MPTLSTTRALLLAALMAVATVAAALVRPAPMTAERVAQISLERLVPRQFADWHEEASSGPMVVNPQQQELIDRIYAQTLQRTYVNAAGDRVMLSIAYGGTYDKGMATHRPEICYPAQGFQILRKSTVELPFEDGVVVPAERLVAQAGQRIEPITYWLVVGGAATQFGLPMRLQQIKIGLTGIIPDGMLFRVSSIGNDDNAAFATQQQFATQLIKAIPSNERWHFLGRQQ